MRRLIDTRVSARAAGTLTLVLALASAGAVLSQGGETVGERTVETQERLSASAQAGECLADSERLEASYAISSTRGKPVVLEFLRDGNRVMYRYPDKGLADRWSLTANGYLKPVRFFLDDQRAIEYDAFDINGGRGSKNWEARSQWIRQAQIDGMEKVGMTGEGCRRIETYEYKPLGKNGSPDPFSNISLVWMPELRLVKSYEIRSSDAIGQRRVTRWELQELRTGNLDDIALAMTAYDGFGATDYADIGDNESDPFLLKMIRLGFVQHGSSGFYQSDGSPLAGGHFH